MRRIWLLVVLLLALPGGAAAQFIYRWTPVPMDSTWDAMKDFRATLVIEKYDAQVAPLQEIVGYSEAEYDKYRPESPLSNFAADVVRAVAEKKTGEKVDVSLMNFGGIRLDEIPQGNVLLDDFVSMFPFKNHLCWVQLSGADLRRLFEQIARENIQVIGGARLVIDGTKLVSAEIAGQPLDDAKDYGVATVDFLLDGGDKLYVARNAKDLVITKMMIYDAMMNYVRAETAAGRPLTYQTDGRVVIRK